MPALSFKKKDLPFLLGGDGEVAVSTGNLRPNQPLPDDATTVLSVAFKAGGSTRTSLGQDGTVKIGLSTAASVDLTPVFGGSTGAQAKLLKTYGLGDFFRRGANADKVILVFDTAASAELSASTAFTYATLKASVEVDAGADGAYAYARALDRSLPIQRLLGDFFKTMRLPEQGQTAPAPGEAIALQYGGYLRLSAAVSAGYQLAGTKDISIGQLALSETYDLSIIGKIGLKAGVAGRFSILVTAGELDGWARVQVRRQRSRDLKVAADVAVDFKNELQDLPATANEFLGAALGVNGKSFLEVLRRVGELSEFDKLETALDGLAKKYIEDLTGKAFDRLGSSSEFPRFLGGVNKIVKSDDRFGNRAVSLFERYFDKLGDLRRFLDRLKGLQPGGLKDLRKDLDPQGWNILAQLTDGDPLGFLVDEVTAGGKRVDSVAELNARAADALSLIDDVEHAELRQAIAVAKQRFSIERLFSELAKVDTVDELQAVATEKLGLFVTRLVGRTLDSATNLKLALSEIQAVLHKIDGFAEKLYRAFKEAANSAYKASLHAEYTRASESDALVDLSINLRHALGPDLLSQAGKGDFEELLRVTNPDVVLLREGTFTHRASRGTAFKVNIVGWHLDYKYEGFDRVITETEQRVLPSERGLTVLTTASVEVERERRRRDEAVHVHFLLRALGESAKAVRADGRSLAYLVDTLEGLTADYQLEFTDQDTSAVELRDYLAFARDLGLSGAGATFEELEPLLPRGAGGFGKCEAAYEVRFGQKALAALLTVKQISAGTEAVIRNSMRQIVLSNYLKTEGLHDVAFAYASPATFDRFREEGFAAFTNTSSRELPVRLLTAIAAPSRVALNRMELNLLATLYDIESSLVDSVKDLYKLLNGGKAMDPGKFERALGRFGEAMNSFDRFDQTSGRHETGTSTVFVLFDALVRLAAPDGTANTAVLRLRSEAGGREVEKIFMTNA